MALSSLSKSPFVRGGTMGDAVRELDWSKTPLGPVDAWPQSLRTAAAMCLESGFPMLVVWGPEMTMIYNDGYIPVLGGKHPAALGQPLLEVWSEIRDILSRMFGDVIASGKPIYSEDLMFPLGRHGFTEECYFTFSYSPLRDETGAVGGVLVTCTETSQRVVHERRLRALADIANRTQLKTTEEAVWAEAADALSRAAHDLPLAALYRAEPASNRLVRVDGKTDFPGLEIPWTRGQGAEDDCKEVPVPAGIVREPWPEPITRGVQCIVGMPGAEPYGALVVGTSPRRPFDADYQTFIGLVARQIATSITNARTTQFERERANALAEIDRTKTEFFSNVSHEFRTPLTLLLGPLEEMIPKTPPGPERDALEASRRNALRLLKLVNNLLDFSRVEAGRADARFEPADLAAATADIASAFRAAVERAGLVFRVEAPPLPRPVLVDLEAWEKIILNLVSNAVKFTSRGSIQVQVQDAGDAAEVRVADSGVGIPESEMPHLFERFHRVRRDGARSYEGTGIGLALARELVRLHGGRIDVQSEVGRGTTFTVRLPYGSAHLPEAQVSRSQTARQSSALRAAFLDEAVAWRPTEPVPGENLAQTGRATLLVVDDNADMRAYMRRLLSPHWNVVLANDGEDALEVLAREPIDLVLSDIMMPKLDGLGMLRRIRENPVYQLTPVVLVSARAGEEESGTGLDHGADDYIVKPFTARELVARINTHLTLSRERMATREAERVAHMETQRARAAMEEVLESVTDGVFSVGRDGRVLYANPHFLALARWPTSGYIGRNVWDLWPEAKNSAFFRELKAVTETGKPRAFSTFLPEYDSWLEARAFPSNGGIVVYVQEITERRRLEQEIRDRGRQQAAIAHLGQAALRGRSIDLLLTEATHEAAETMGVEFARLIEASQSPPGFRVRAVVGWKAELVGTFTPRDFEAELAFQSDEPLLLDDLRMDPQLKARYHQAQGIVSGVTIPIPLGDRKFGALSVHTRRRRRFTRDEVLFLQSLAHIVASAAEIGQHRSRLEDLVLERTEKLATANKELEAFNYTVSHDLRTPLRAIDGFSQLLVQHHANELGPEPKALLSQVRAGVERMGHLVQSLLTFARIGRAQMSMQSVDISSLAEQIVTELKQRQPRPRMHIRIQAGLAAEADPQLLRVVLSNLLDNAWKFTARVPVPEILLSERTLGTETVFCVEDNGVGFDMTYYPKLFRPFERLHSNVQFEGTGIGLATVARIIERHGGRIWAEGQEGRGASFFFTLRPPPAPAS